MRIFIALVVVAVLGWSGYWFWGANRVDEAVGDAIADLEASGWTVETGGWDVRGFPNRFDTMIRTPDVTGPEGTYGWVAPFVQIMALSYQPNRAIVAFANDQEVAGPWGTAAVESARARGSITVQPGETLVLDHSSFVLEDVSVTDGDRVWALSEVLFATRLPEEDAGGAVQNIGLTLADLDLPAALTRGLAPDAARIGGVSLDANVTLTEPLGLAGTNTVAVEAVEIVRLNVDWGEIGVTADGTLTAGPDGYAEGEIDLDIRDWRAALSRAGQLGVVAEDDLGAIEQAVGFLTGLTGGGDRLSLPLVFRDGRAFVGPVPVAEAPRLR